MHCVLAKSTFRALIRMAPVLAGLILMAPTRGDEQLAGVACRSVHLGFYAIDPVAFYQEVTVEKSAPGTYFMVCGWSRGYFGLQELATGKKIILFSVWDSEEDNPDAAALSNRVVTFEPAEGVTVRRFGNEGSGGQSFYEYDWKVGETYRFCVSCEPFGSRTAYSGWFFHPEKQAWVRLMTFAARTHVYEKLSRLYCFVEDFRRNRESMKHARIARFANQWTLDDEGRWAAISTARFTADDNPAENIDAGIREAGFYLATGGQTKSSGIQVRDRLTLETPPSTPPEWKPLAVLKDRRPVD
jgi:hypothetical protein